MSPLPTRDPELLSELLWPDLLPQCFSKKKVCVGHRHLLPIVPSHSPLNSGFRNTSSAGKADLAERQTGPLTLYNTEARDVVFPPTRTLFQCINPTHVFGGEFSVL